MQNDLHQEQQSYEKNGKHCHAGTFARTARECHAVLHIPEDSETDSS
jgi:hypothetical protein